MNQKYSFHYFDIGFIFGLSATITLSILVNFPSLFLIKTITSDNKNKLFASFHFGSVGGKYLPISPVKVLLIMHPLLALTHQHHYDPNQLSGCCT